MKINTSRFYGVTYDPNREIYTNMFGKELTKFEAMIMVDKSMGRSRRVDLDKARAEEEIFNKFSHEKI